MATIALVLYGMTFVGLSCFLLGRATAPAEKRADTPEEMTLTENERKTLRELQNFLQYDGFSQT